MLASTLSAMLPISSMNDELLSVSVSVPSFRSSSSISDAFLWFSCFVFSLSPVRRERGEEFASGIKARSAVSIISSFLFHPLIHLPASRVLRSYGILAICHLLSYLVWRCEVFQLALHIKIQYRCRFFLKH